MHPNVFYRPFRVAYVQVGVYNKAVPSNLALPHYDIDPEYVAAYMLVRQNSKSFSRYSVTSISALCAVSMA